MCQAAVFAAGASPLGPLWRVGCKITGRISGALRSITRCPEARFSFRTSTFLDVGYRLRGRLGLTVRRSITCRVGAQVGLTRHTFAVLHTRACSWPGQMVRCTRLVHGQWLRAGLEPRSVLDPRLAWNAGRLERFAASLVSLGRCLCETQQACESSCECTDPAFVPCHR